MARKLATNKQQANENTLINTTKARITNNVPTVQTINQVIGAVSDQFKAQQLCVPSEIQEQGKSTNVRFAALAEQMQQLISTTAAATNVFGRPPIQVKPKAPSMDTLYNNEFSHTACSEEELPRSAPQRCLTSTANPFGFWDYPPDDYYHHPQPQYEMPRTSHREEDSRIKTIFDNMHPLIIDGAATNK
uniref:Uncharacterized protein n=1 Tax=Romanomermis culicivorax TaxID=13658 RepID=A0A915HGX7_ROMCU